MAQQIRLTSGNKDAIKELKRYSQWSLLSENKIGNIAIQEGVKALHRKVSPKKN